MFKKTIVFFVLIFFSLQIFSQEENKDFYITKGKGFEFHFFDDQYELQLDFRGQFRASYPFDNDPITFENEKSGLKINRARIKIGGHIYQPYYTFYFEQDIKGMNLLDFRVQIEKYSFLKLRVGQWKVRYSRERVISSGNQQGLDRSIINYAFTLDRQQGISLYGNLSGDGIANFNYWASVFMGSGRGANSNDDSKLMYMGRLQWNPNNEVLKFSGSDLEYHDKFVSSFAIAATTNTSRYTRFSTAGGGQLVGFEEGVDGQYKIDQFLFETAFKYKGWSWQQEYHYKNIDDKINLTSTSLTGYYLQLGYFLNNSFSKIPKKLEVFGRYAYYDPNIDVSNNNELEYTFGLNWFFHKHKNKLTLEYSYLDFNDFSSTDKSGSKIRLQWDISIF